MILPACSSFTEAATRTKTYERHGPSRQPFTFASTSWLLPRSGGGFRMGVAWLSCLASASPGRWMDAAFSHDHVRAAADLWGVVS